MGGKRVVALLVLVAMLGLFTSCAGKRRVPPGDDRVGVTDPSQAGVQPGDIYDEGLQRPPSGVAVSIPELRTVYFDYDKSDLRADTIATLEENLRWLRANPTRQILIEGHCDERGSEEYNLSLGDRRAKSVMQYLIQAGIPAARLYTISYGEEFPVDPRSNEEAWAKNRRAEFKVYQ